MKTSNIILLVIFAIILIWITAGFVTAKNKIKTFINDNPEAIIQKDLKEKRETINTESFHTIIVTGDGELNIEKAKENSFDQVVDDTNTIDVRNDTLFINVSGKECNLSVVGISGIHMNESVRVDIYGLELDSFTIHTNDASSLKVKDLNCSALTVNAMDKSKIKLRNVNKKSGMKADFILKDNSILEINDTKGMSLSIQKDADAKYEDD